MTFHQFLSLLEFIKNGKKTSYNLTEQLKEFTILNLQRMSRIVKTYKPDESLLNCLKHIESPQNWYVLTEVWCGDSAQILPILNQIAENSNGLIRLNILLRDNNPDIMDQYLTNGSRSIPKLIATDDSGEEIFTWGPRPAEAQKLFQLWKETKTISWDGFEIQLHKWYNADKGVSIEREIIQKIERTCLKTISQ